MTERPTSASPAHVATAIVLDAILVVAFAASGRATHEGDVLGEAGLGLATTAWPFLVALVVGWVVSLGWRRPASPLRTGVPVWIVTVAGGMLLRWASDQGTALPFIIVATVTLLLFLVGWRLIWQFVLRVRRSRDRAETRGNRP